MASCNLTFAMKMYCLTSSVVIGASIVVILSGLSFGRGGLMRVNAERDYIDAPRLLVSIALHHATDFCCDANLDICFAFQLRDVNGGR